MQVQLPSRDPLHPFPQILSVAPNRLAAVDIDKVHTIVMTRNICISGGDGHTGFLIAEIILTNNDFKSKVDSVSVLCLHPSGARAKELSQLGK